jgi:hypothetical protein
MFTKKKGKNFMSCKKKYKKRVKTIVIVFQVITPGKINRLESEIIINSYDYFKGKFFSEKDHNYK